MGIDQRSAFARRDGSRGWEVLRRVSSIGSMACPLRAALISKATTYCAACGAPLSINLRAGGVACTTGRVRVLDAAHRAVSPGFELAGCSQDAVNATLGRAGTTRSRCLPFEP